MRSCRSPAALLCRALPCTQRLRCALYGLGDDRWPFFGGRALWSAGPGRREVAVPWKPKLHILCLCRICWTWLTPVPAEQRIRVSSQSEGKDTSSCEDPISLVYKVYKAGSYTVVATDIGQDTSRRSAYARADSLGGAAVPARPRAARAAGPGRGGRRWGRLRWGAASAGC